MKPGDSRGYLGYVLFVLNQNCEIYIIYHSILLFFSLGLQYMTFGINSEQ